MNASTDSLAESKSFDIVFEHAFVIDIPQSITVICDVSNKIVRLTTCNTYDSAFSLLLSYVKQYEEFLRVQKQKANRVYSIICDGVKLLDWDTINRRGVINEMVC